MLPDTPRPGRSAEHRVLLAVALVVPVALALIGLYFEPDARGVGTHEQLGLRPCTTLELFGVPCPGCGVTTSVTLAVHGRPWDSLRTQPFGFLLAAGAVAFVAWAAWGQLTGRDLYELLTRLRVGRWAVVLLVVVLSSWVYKIATL